MLLPNRVRALTGRGEAALGCWLFMASASNAELLSHVGFDALIVDLEHSPGGLGEAVGQMRAAGGRPDGPALFVRVPGAASHQIKPLLDAGAEGVMAPTVESAEEVAALVSATRYPPHGTRGLHYTVSRAAHWGAATADYPAHAASQIMTIAMIESAKGVTAIPEMAAVPGIDMFFIGPLDLSASIGVAGDYQAPEFRDLWDEAERRVLESGVLLGGTILPGHPAPRLIDRGYRFVTVGADASFLRNAASAALAMPGVSGDD